MGTRGAVGGAAAASAHAGLIVVEWLGGSYDVVVGQRRGGRSARLTVWRSGKNRCAGAHVPFYPDSVLLKPGAWRSCEVTGRGCEWDRMLSWFQVEPNSGRRILAKWRVRSERRGPVPPGATSTFTRKAGGAINSRGHGAAHGRRAGMLAAAAEANLAPAGRSSAAGGQSRLKRGTLRPCSLTASEAAYSHQMWQGRASVMAACRAESGSDAHAPK